MIWSGWMAAGDVRPEPRGLLGLSGGLVDAADAAYGGVAMADLGPWRIVRTLGRDLCGAYYVGRSDEGERATLYVLSGERVAVGEQALGRLVAAHRGVAHAGLLTFRGMDRDGGDCYLVASGVDDALTPLRSGPRPAPGQIAPFGAALAAALATAHEHDLIHGALTFD